MGNLVKKIQIASPYNIGAYESWLSDLAGQGLFLIKIGFVFCTFERKEPMQMEYRIDISKEKVSKERRNLYEECGWEYVASRKWAHVFCAPSGTETTEMHTDAKEQGFTLVELTNSLRITAAIIFICTLFILGISCLMLFFNNSPYLNLIENGETWIYMFFAYILLLFALSKLFFEVHMLKQTLFKGRKINHHESWKKHKIYTILISLIALPIFVVEIMSMTVMTHHIIAEATDTARFAITQETKLPVVLLRDIEDLDDAIDGRKFGAILSDAYENGTVDDIPGDTIIYDSSVNTLSSLMALTQYEVIESANARDESYEAGLTSKYYKLTFACMADGTLHDLMYSEFEAYNEYPTLKIETTKLDYDGLDNVYMSDTDGFIYLFASKDNIVVSLRYYGEKSATELLDALADVLNES